MKALKRAAQKNAKLNEYYYRPQDLPQIAALDDDVFMLQTSVVDYRVSLENAKIDVELDPYGHYTVVVTTQHNRRYYVTLD